jgi:hypothetical protein
MRTTTTQTTPTLVDDDDESTRLCAVVVVMGHHCHERTATTAPAVWTEMTAAARRNVLPSYQTFETIGYCLERDVDNVDDHHQHHHHHHDDCRCFAKTDSFWSLLPWWLSSLSSTTTAIQQQRQCLLYQCTRTVPKAVALWYARPFPHRRRLLLVTAAAAAAAAVAAITVLWTLSGGTLLGQSGSLDGAVAEAYLDYYTYDTVVVATNHSSQQREPQFVNDNSGMHIPTDALGLDESAWVWDHNVYYEPKAVAASNDDDANDDDNHGTIESIQTISISTSGSITIGSRIQAERNLLIAQVAGIPSSHNGDSSDQNSTTTIGWLLAQDDVLLHLVSRPNRAYARQWGRNYVRFRPYGKNHTISSGAVANDELLVVTFLKDLMEHQKAKHALKHPHHEFKPYDAVAVLPPGAIVTDLDYDLLSLLPDDKLLAMTGWDSDMSSDDVMNPPASNVSASSMSDIGIAAQVLLMNLRHPLAESVVHQWWQALNNESSSPFTMPGNEAVAVSSNVLRHIVASTTLSVGDSESSVVPLTVAEGDLVLEAAPQPTDDNETMHEIKAGSMASCIKMCASPTKSNSVSSWPSTSTATGRSDSAVEVARALLQYTADAVCYRYYPKCDIL